jgi:tetratricopeptide (TPR) repeat protein
VLAVWGLVLTAYSNAFQGGLVFDNVTAVVEDARIRALTGANLRQIIGGEYWYHLPSGLYRPLTTFSYLINYSVLGNGTDPAGYHAVNLLLHAVNVALVYALGLTFLGGANPAWALAAIWAVHPLLTEAVTNIVGRADLLAAFGVLAGLLCYVRGTGADPAPGRRPWAWVAALGAAQAVGIFSKENAAILPGAMLLYDLTWPERARWRKRLPFYAALLLPIGVYFLLRAQLHAHVPIGSAENPLVAVGFWTARLTALEVIGKWLFLFLWPAHLSADYSYNAVPVWSWRGVEALLALALCAAAAVMTIRCYKSRKDLFYSLAFFFIALLPTSNLLFPIGSIMAERFMYLPSIGLAGCAVALGRRLPARGRLPAAILVCAVLAGRTYARNFDWRDELTLWSSAVSVNPGSYKTHAELANALAQIPGRLPEAVAEYQAALRIRPDFAEGHQNLGNAFMQMPGHLAEAAEEYRAALRYQPDMPEVHYSLGNALAEMGRQEEAISEYRQALHRRPDFAEAHGALGNALLKQPDHLTDAIAEYREALRLNPDLPEAHYNLATALLRVPGKLPEAIEEYEAAQRLRPDPELEQLLERLRAARR